MSYLDELLSGAPVEIVSDVGVLIDVDDRGRGRRRTVRTRISLDGAEELEVVEALPPPKYYGGTFRTKPRDDVEIAMGRALIASAVLDTTLDLECVCLTCEKRIAEQWREIADGQTERVSWNTIFGAANDHVQTTVNHAVMVLETQSGMDVYRSPYAILGTQS